MDRERFARLERLFTELCDTPPERRATVLEQLRTSEPELAQELARMLAADGASATAQLHEFGKGVALLAGDAVRAGAPVPAAIGPFRILDVLGSGGMGTVYRAEQQSPRRLVALKVLRPGSASEQALRRFALEAELLGRLQHPGIAQIFDAGTALVGDREQPWFALELIDGAPLTQFARESRLGTRGKLELLAKIADAIHHAHQKGIVHRDLKPANILVTPAGEPKVVDFGIARMTAAQAQSHEAPAQVTQAGQLLGTLAYMSPEQANGVHEAIDTRTDVWALGVVAYELLCGRLPHAVDGLPLTEAARRIVEEEPLRLGQIDRSLKGDIETIVARALEKEPARRYPSAHEFAADLRRHLHDEPIVAHRPSTTYQLAKFARRHRGLVAGGAIALLALTAAAIGMSVALLRARAENRTAVTVAAILEGLITAPDPWAGGGEAARETRVVDALRRAEPGLADAFRGDLEVEASVRATLGRTYLNLGDYEHARPHLERALALRRERAGVDAVTTLHVAGSLAALEINLGRYAEGEQLARETLDLATRARGESDPVALESAALLANALRAQKKLAEAFATAQRAFDVATQALGPDDAETLRAGHNLAAMQIAMGDGKGSEARLVDVVARRAKRFGEDHPLTIASRGALAEAIWRQDRAAEALPLARANQAAYSRMLGDRHLLTLRSTRGLAVNLAAAGQPEEALVMWERLLPVAREVLGPTHPELLDFAFAHALQLHGMRRLAEAESSCRALIELERAAAPKSLPPALNLMATLLVDQGKPDEAIPFFEEALDRSEVPEDHWVSAMYHVNYGNALRLAGRLDDAEPELRESVLELEATLGLANSNTQYALAKWVLLLEAMGEKDEAREQRARLTRDGLSHAR